MSFDEKHVRACCVATCPSTTQVTPASLQADYRHTCRPQRKLEMLDARRVSKQRSGSIAR